MNEEKDNAENPLAMTLSKASGDESFPVLKAFQDFIDQERERARRRVVTLSVCFISAIVVLVLLFGIIFAMFFGHMMRSNEDQQNRLYDLYARSGLLPAAAPAPAPAAPAATTPIPASATPVAPDDQVRGLLERIRLLEAGQAPDPAAPAPSVSAEPVPAPASPVAAPAPSVKLPKGVRSSPRKADQEAKLAAEAQARRERAAAREAEAAAKAEAVRQAREAKAAEEAAAREAEAKAAEAAKARGPRTISVRKQRRMVVPEGCSTDEIVVQTESGARVPLRTLLPVEGASLE